MMLKMKDYYSIYSDRRPGWSRVISIFLIVWFACHFLAWLLHLLLNPVLYDSYGITEFLINFQGGFVRRGMLGSGLYALQSSFLPHDGVSVIYIIYSISLLCFGAALAWYVRAFRRKGYCWWLLMSPFMFGYLPDVVKKDYMLYLFVIAIFLLLRRDDAGVWRRVGATCLLIVALLLHEAFLFWGVPIAALIFLTDKRHRALNIACLAVTLAVAAVLFWFKGTPGQAQTIFASWNQLGVPLDPTYRENSIYALGWDSVHTFGEHLRTNFFQWGYTGWAGIVVRPLVWLLVFYFISNFLWPHSTSNIQHSTLPSAFLFLSLCLLPMFTILSCDYGRLHQYIVMTSVAALLIFPQERLAGLFPGWWMRFAGWLNGTLVRIVPPTRGLMVILLFTLSVSPYCFGQASAFRMSILGDTIELIWKILHLSFS